MADPTAGGQGRRLLLVRHGRTAWNAERRAQGHADVDLDDTGRSQAAALAPYLASVAPVTLWASDLARAQSTAGILARATGLSVTTDPRLREYHLGARTGLTMAEYEAAFPEEYAAFRSGRYDVTPGGESTPRVVGRVLAALRDVLESLAAGQTAAVVSHGAALKVSLVALLGWPEAAAASLRGLDNAGLAVVEEAGFGGRLRLTAYNLRPGTPDFASHVPVG